MDVKQAQKMAAVAKDYWADIYAAFKDDVRFSIGLDHWSDNEIRDRGKENCMIVPILPQYIHQVVNDMRMNTPSIHVLPGEDDESDEETAEVLRGLIRSIEYKSKSDTVYDTAGEYAVRGGFGFARVDHDYVSSDSFLQELKLLRVHNPESCYIDPRSVECDGSDAMYGFVYETISKDEFEEKYPGKNFVSFDAEVTTANKEEIVICEFFLKELKVIEKQLTDSGEIIDNVEDPDPEKEKAKRKRKLRKVVIRRFKFSGEDKLEETTFPGIYIPIVLFCGEEVWIDGKRNLLSLIRNAKDAQRRVNKWASKESEILDMAPIAPVMAPYGAVDDFMEEWGSPGDNMVLRYKTTDIQGNPLDKPERLAPPPIPTGIINAMQGAKENVKEALGMYSASLGQRSNAVSGVAYNAQKEEGDVATYHFGDNRNRSVEQIGRILIFAIPEVYDTDRIIQVIGKEEKPKSVGINGRKTDKQDRDFDLRKGVYGARVVLGASYTTKRQEEAAVLGEIMAKRPEMMTIAGDLYFASLDTPGAQALSDRMRKAIPPNLLEGEDGQEQNPQVMQLTQALQQAQAQIQQLAAELESKQGEIEVKKMDIQLKGAELQVKAQELGAPQDNGLVFDQYIKQREMDLKRDEILLKNKELDIKRLEIELKYPPRADAEQAILQHQLDEEAADSQLERDLIKQSIQPQEVLNAP